MNQYSQNEETVVQSNEKEADVNETCVYKLQKSLLFLSI